MTIHLRDIVLLALLLARSITSFAACDPYMVVGFNECMEREQKQRLQEIRQESEQYMQRSYERSNQQMQQLQNQYSPPPTNPFLSQPSLGAMGDAYVFINGEIVQYQKNPERVIALVQQGSHRKITGVYLPPGYQLTYPEQLELLADNLIKNRGLAGRVQNWFK